MLDRVTSKELSELRAYETVNGPIGPQYAESVLAAIQEQLQEVCRLLIAQGVEDEDDIPKLHHYPRPYELYQLEEPDGS